MEVLNYSLLFICLSSCCMNYYQVIYIDLNKNVHYTPRLCFLSTSKAF